MSDEATQNNAPMLQINSITMHDLIQFKEEILKDMKNYENNCIRNIKMNFNKYDELLKKAINKLTYYEKDKQSFISKLNFIEEKEAINFDIKSKAEDLTSKIKLNENHIDSLFKDFSNACFKYDKIYNDNLYVPGLIGNMCKHSNLR